jgi:hypothetical protein
MHRKVRLTYANVVSTVCLFVVLGGGAYAASALPRNSVGAKQIKRNAVGRSEIKARGVTSSEVKNFSLRKKDFKSGQLPSGPVGLQGPPGGALGYAHVDDSGTFDPSLSNNVVSSALNPVVAGTYCIDFAVPVHNAVASISGVPSDHGEITTYVVTARSPCKVGGSNGPPGDVQVSTSSSAGNLDERSFDIVVN